MIHLPLRLMDRHRTDVSILRPEGADGNLDRFKLPDYTVAMLEKRIGTHDRFHHLGEFRLSLEHHLHVQYPFKGTSNRLMRLLHLAYHIPPLLKQAHEGRIQHKLLFFLEK